MTHEDDDMHRERERSGERQRKTISQSQEELSNHIGVKDREAARQSLLEGVRGEQEIITLPDSGRHAFASDFREEVRKLLR